MSGGFRGEERVVRAEGRTVGALVADVLRREARDAGLTVTDDPAGPTRILQTEVLYATVRVGNDGARGCGVGLKFRLIDPTGKPRYERSVEGTGSGRPTRRRPPNTPAELYQQALSDALKRATNKLLSDEAFVNALRDAKE